MKNISICFSLLLVLALPALAADPSPSSKPVRHESSRVLVEKCPACDSEIRIQRDAAGEFRVICSDCRKEMAVTHQNVRQATFECADCRHRVELARLEDHRVSVNCQDCGRKLVLNCPDCVKGQLRYANFTKRGTTLSCTSCHGAVAVRD